MNKLIIKLSSYDKKLLLWQLNRIQEINKFIYKTNIKLQVRTNKEIFQKRTMNRSPHVDKKARHQYEFRQYILFINILNQESIIQSLFIKLICKYIIPGVILQIQNYTLYNL